jgi:hypothetical protein
MKPKKTPKKDRCYVSLVIYSKSDIGNEISEKLGALPFRAGEKNGIYSWGYTTNKNGEKETVEENLRLIRGIFSNAADWFIELSKQGCLFRLWIYFETREVNKGFIIDDDDIKWLHSFGADIYVDIYNWDMMNVGEGP